MCGGVEDGGGKGRLSLEPVDEKHTFVTKPLDLYTARELHLTYAPVICNHGPYRVEE